MRDSQKLPEAVDKPVIALKTVNRRSVLRRDLQRKKIWIQVRIGVEGRVWSLRVLPDEVFGTSSGFSYDSSVLNSRKLWRRSTRDLHRETM